MQRVKILLFLLSCTLLQSCMEYPMMHYSVAQNVPMITEKGEAIATVASGTETFGVQAAYGLGSAVAVMGSYSSGVNDVLGNYNGVTVDNGLRSNWELGLGYYNKITSHVYFEIYGGVERYSRNYAFTDFYNRISDTFGTHASIPFAQFDLNFLNNKKNGLALSCKIGDLTFDGYHDNYHVGNRSYFNSYYASPGNYQQFIIEPCLTYKMSGRNFGFQAQLGTTYVMTDGFEYFVSAGLMVRIFNH